MLKKKKSNVEFKFLTKFGRLNETTKNGKKGENRIIIAKNGLLQHLVATLFVRGNHIFGY